MAAQQHGFNVKGIEAGNIGSFLKDNYNIPIKQMYITQENIKNELDNANIISLFDVLEHIPDPQSLLLTVSQNMPDNSYVVASVPRHPSYSLFCNLCFPDQTSRYLVVPDHIHIFSDDSLSRMFRSSGLEITDRWYFGQDFYEMLNTMLLLANKELSDIPDTYFANINFIQGSIDKCRLSDSIMVIAKKST